MNACFNNNYGIRAGKPKYTSRDFYKPIKHVRTGARLVSGRGYTCYTKTNNEILCTDMYYSVYLNANSCYHDVPCLA